MIYVLQAPRTLNSTHSGATAISGIIVHVESHEVRDTVSLSKRADIHKGEDFSLEASV